MEASTYSGFVALIETIRDGSAGTIIADRYAVSDSSGRRWTYADLVAAASRLARRLRDHGAAGVMLLRAGQAIDAVAALLGGLAAGYQVILQGESDGGTAGIEQAFEPDAIFDRDGLRLNDQQASPVYPGPSILLSTSGTTGSSKYVRLSLAALAVNARQIVGALGITHESVALAHLPVHYSYGLSVLTSHLDAGAATYLTESAFTQSSFWQDAAAAGATHLPGVPFHYQFLARGALNTLVPPCITTFTQAGGTLALPFRQRIHDAVVARGGRFHVMYGQTEAGPRITTLDHDDFAANPASVGRVLAGGTLRIVDATGADVAPGDYGEVVYSGPNLMAGYAVSRGDLAAADTPLASIRTGDRGMLDSAGFLTLGGRESGFAKIGGLRISLDDMAGRLTSAADLALLPGDDKVHVFHIGADADLKAQIGDVARGYGIPIGSFALHPLPALPRHASGKIDYQRLREMTG